jgi:hypothetical protein
VVASAVAIALLLFQGWLIPTSITISPGYMLTFSAIPTLGWQVPSDDLS